MELSDRGRAFVRVTRAAVLCAALLSPPVLFEIALAVPLPTVVYLVYGALAVPVVWVALARHGAAVSSLTVAGMVATLCVLHLVPWSSRKAFLARFTEVRPGMPVAAVERALAPYEFQESQVSELDTVRSYVHSREPEFDSDWGIIRIRGGRVVDTEFLPD